MTSRGTSQQALADLIGVTRASVNDWCRGRAVPPPETVFAVERALEVKAGVLSRTLGYLPLEVEDRPPTNLPGLIAEAPELHDQARRILLAVYEELTRP